MGHSKEFVKGGSVPQVFNVTWFRVMTWSSQVSATKNNSVLCKCPPKQSGYLSAQDSG